jgi:thioredoxin reductase
MFEQVEVLIIGAGQAGLAMGYQMIQQNRKFVILEQSPQREHVNFARTDELLKSGRINENRGRNQFLLNNETSQSEKTPETSSSGSKNSVSRSRD